MNENSIARFTRDELPESQTDWRRLDAMTEEEIEANAATDLDNPPWTDEDLAAAELLMPSTEGKEPVSIRYDKEVVDYFRSMGAGYQSRMNAVLLAYVRRRKSVRPR
jgi:uncharacterized protein (DUF4415 family)